MWSWASYSLCLSSSIHKTGILRALLIKLLWELCELICVQHLEQCLVQSRYSINVSCCYSLLVNSEFYIYSCRIWWSQARCCARHYRAVREFLLHSVHSFMFIRGFFFFFLFIHVTISLFAHHHQPVVTSQGILFLFNAGNSRVLSQQRSMILRFPLKLKRYVTSPFFLPRI